MQRRYSRPGRVWPKRRKRQDGASVPWQETAEGAKLIRRAQTEIVPALEEIVWLDQMRGAVERIKSSLATTDRLREILSATHGKNVVVKVAPPERREVGRRIVRNKAGEIERVDIEYEP